MVQSPCSADLTGLAPPPWSMPLGPPPGWQGSWGYIIQIQWQQWFALQNPNVPPPGWQGPWGIISQTVYPQMWAQWMSTYNPPSLLTQPGSLFNPNTPVPLYINQPTPSPFISFPLSQYYQNNYQYQMPWFNNMQLNLQIHSGIGQPHFFWNHGPHLNWNYGHFHGFSGGFQY